jgi:exonuclease I
MQQKSNSLIPLGRDRDRAYCDCLFRYRTHNYVSDDTREEDEEWRRKKRHKGTQVIAMKKYEKTNVTKEQIKKLKLKN